MTVKINNKKLPEKNEIIWNRINNISEIILIYNQFKVKSI